jgi:hypothetical protein
MIGDVLKRLKHFDAYPKTLEDFRVKTFAGACITVLAVLAISVLFIYEWKSYVTIDVDQELFVDLTRHQKLTINLNMTMTNMPCSLITIDAADVSGENNLEGVKGLKKIRINQSGRLLDDPVEIKTTTPAASPTNETGLVNANLCLSCYGAESPNIKCCNTCSDVRTAYKLKGWQFVPYTVARILKRTAPIR